MNKATELLDCYRRFLESIPLAKFRAELKDIKWVEQDLYPRILPLSSLFRNYWHERSFDDFETWFEHFWLELHSNPQSFEELQRFKKYYFDKDDNGWFKKGFKARMYRTWVSFLTQLDFCYLFVSACEKQGKTYKLETNAELDQQGIDFRINQIDFQVKKITQRKEARPSESGKKRLIIPYAVYDIDDFERRAHSDRVSPESKTAYQKSLQAFLNYFIQLKNGFVVFNENYVTQILDNIENESSLRALIKHILKELSGE